MAFNKLAGARNLLLPVCDCMINMAIFELFSTVCFVGRSDIINKADR